MAKISCLHCGAPVDPGCTVCPDCRALMKKKSPVRQYLIAGGIAVIIFLVIAACS